jgi:arginine/lysine/ornithine decarboxylase
MVDRSGWAERRDAWFTGLRGGAVLVDPIKLTLKAPGIKQLKL